MITEKDLKHLRKLEKPRNVFIMRWLMPFFIVFMVAEGIGNLFLARKFAAYDGLSFTGQTVGSCPTFLPFVSESPIRQQSGT